MAGVRSVWTVLTRKRVFEPHQLEEGNLRRCLSIWDLTALGVGSTLGVGVYVIVGSVALHLAGPSIVLSFLIAAVASLFAGLCFAEFGARVPRSGSAYIYTYVTVGEVVAFIIGWNMILEALFGTASVARGLTMYVDSMVNRSMSEWMTSTMPMDSTLFSPYFDLLSFFIVLVLGVLLAIGVRESAMVNNIFTGINVAIILFIIIAGAFKADSSNWSIAAEQVPDGKGTGGFFPYGVWGTLRGAAVCFYGFVGFDTISATGEEVREPRRVIPIAILSVIALVFVAYAGVAIVITMMLPYYLQDDVAAVATVFSHVGLEWARWVVSIGAVFGISARIKMSRKSDNLFGAMFPLPRLLYAMASDGLLFHLLKRLNAKKTPVIATLVPAVIIAILAAILELNELVLMMCIGTLLSYTIVAVCVIVLRYRSQYSVAGSGWLRQALGFGLKSATTTSAAVVHVSLFLFTLTCVTVALIGAYVSTHTIVMSVLHAVALALVLIMTLQPQTDEELSFKTPLVPIVPCLSIYINIHLMVLINVQTWIRVAIWIAIGIPVYILCLCLYKRKDGGNLHGNLKSSTHVDMNGKPPVQIIVETPTPPDTTGRSNTGGDHSIQYYGNESDPKNAIVEEKILRNQPILTEEIIVQHAFVEDNEEKEAKIIDLLDQVLQAEEDSYGEVISLKEPLIEDDTVATMQASVIHRKSLSELSDAGSDASMGNQVLSKYDVIAQVHREDLPKVNEEEETVDSTLDLREKEDQDELNDNEEITAFNDSDTNSRTDESGYSDTIDRLNESAEDMSQEIVNIPVPPPLDENFFKDSDFKTPYTISARPLKPKPISGENIPREIIKSNSSQNDGTIPVPPPLDENFFKDIDFQKSYTIPARPLKPKPISGENKPREIIKSNNFQDDSTIPVPPPLDETFFKDSGFKKSYTISARPTKLKSTDSEEENKPRESVKSNSSQDDGTMVFGSDKQMNFMSKLENIFQKTISSNDENDEQRKRSHSMGNVVENTDFALTQNRPSMFLDLKKELLSKGTSSLKPVVVENTVDPEPGPKEEDEDTSLSREELKSKLEIIFKAGGPKLLGPKLMKSNPPTPEEAYQTDTSSTESISKIPKKEKNDTLKRQKDKYGEVLNSFRMSLNKDDNV